MNVTIFSGTRDEEAKRSWQVGLQCMRGCAVTFGDARNILSYTGQRAPQSNFMIDGCNHSEMPDAAMIVLLLHRTTWPGYWRPRVVLLTNDHDFFALARLESMEGILVHAGREDMERVYNFLANSNPSLKKHDPEHASIISLAIRSIGVLAT